MPDPIQPDAPPPAPSSPWKAKLLAAGLILAGGGLSFAGGGMAAGWQQAREERLACDLAGEMLQAFEEALIEQQQRSLPPGRDFLYPSEEPDRLSNNIGQGMRAVALPVHKAMAQMLQPDDRVDVILNFLAPFPEEKEVSLHFIQDARVLAVDKESLMLELTMHEFQWVALAMSSAIAQDTFFSPVVILPRNIQDDGYLEKANLWSEENLFDNEILKKIWDSSVSTSWPIYGGPVKSRFP
jgi:hypothetical protein